MSPTGTVLDLLGLGRSGGAITALLGVLVRERGQDMSISDAARLAKVPKATAARSLDRLVHEGLVLERQQPRERLVEVNTEHPLYPHIVDLLWVADGVEAPDVRPASRPAHEPLFAIHDIDVQRLVPRQLQTSDLDPRKALQDDDRDGPHLAVVRALVLRLDRLSSHFWFEGALQQTYSHWHDERDRDLIHLTLHLGAGVQQASRVLRGQGSAGDLAQTQIGRATWAHVVYALNAEAVMCARTSGFLVRAVDRGRRRRDAEHALATTQESLARAEAAEDEGAAPSRTLASRDVRAGRVAGLRMDVETQARALEDATAALKDYYSHGGTPPAEAVDSAGERIIAVRLRSLTRQLAELVTETSRHPSFQLWQQDHPEVVQEHPLWQEPG